jgi:beta-N-acetylhexosaminidase
VAQNYGFEQAVRQSVLAGADILLFGNNLSYDPDVAAKARNVILDMVRSKEVDKARIAKSWERIMRLKAKLEARPAH